MKPKGVVMFDRFLNLLAIFGVLFLALIELSILSDIFARASFNYPMAWVLPLAEFGLFVICFLAAPWILREEKHVRIDIVINVLGARRRSLLNVMTSILGAGICLTILFYSSQVTLDHLQRGILASMVLEVPKGPLLAIIPVSMFVLLIQFLREIHRHWKILKEPGRKE